MARPQRPSSPALRRPAREVEKAARSLIELSFSALDADPDVPWAQLRALAVVDRYGPLNLSGLAQRTDSSLPSASRLVDRLEAAGLLARSSHPESRREVELRLTREGRAALSRVRSTRAAKIRPVLAAMDAERVDELERALVEFARASADLDLV